MPESNEPSPTRLIVRNVSWAVGTGLAGVLLTVAIYLWWGLSFAATLVALVFVATFLPVFTGDQTVTKRNAQFLFAYVFMFSSLALSTLPFIVSSDFVSSKVDWFQYGVRPISIVRGYTTDGSGPKNLQGPANTQWIVNIGGAARLVLHTARADKLMKSIGTLSVEVAKDYKDVKLNDALANARKKKATHILLLNGNQPAGLASVKEVEARLTQGEDPEKLTFTGWDLSRTAFVGPDARPGLIGGLIDHGKPFALVVPDGDTKRMPLGWIEASTIPGANPTYEVSGGLVMPLYLVVLALLGGAVSLLRRVPEFQRQAVAGQIDNAEVRQHLVFQIAQFLSAPLIAIAAFHVIAPESTAAVVTLAFLSGFSSELILSRIRAAMDAMEPAPKTPASGGVVWGNVTVGGKVEAGVSIQIVDPVRKTTCDDQGHYRIANVPAGKRVLEAKKDDKQCLKNVDVKAGKETRVDIQL